MRYKGVLKRWNDEKGFGFIAPEGGGADVFVHVSAFIGISRRPLAGESLTYAIVSGKDGKNKAVAVRLPDSVEPATVRPVRPSGQRPSRPRPANARPKARSAARSTASGSLLGRMLTGVGLSLAVWVGVMLFGRDAPAPAATPQPVQPAVTSTVQVRQPAFQCDGRKYCSQMSDCAEARYFLRHCPGVEMDGDGDGVPCEQMCR